MTAPTTTGELITRLMTEKLAAVNRATRLETQLEDAESDAALLEEIITELRKDLEMQTDDYFKLRKVIDRIARSVAKHAAIIPREALDDINSALVNAPDDSDIPLPEKDGVLDGELVP